MSAKQYSEKNRWTKNKYMNEKQKDEHKKQMN